MEKITININELRFIVDLINVGLVVKKQGT